MDNKAESSGNYRTLRLSNRTYSALKSRRRDNDRDLTLKLETMIVASQFMSAETKDWLLKGLRKKIELR
ncbi:MAG: hypothetical protein LBC41_01490 [Clostridiales bacterium]|jgi:hypothetical protein|nr:hypothetical protein [Clostridiales bacterium]MDR2749308.1 hypothetical protein [Clostridiales bacterium]